MEGGKGPRLREKPPRDLRLKAGPTPLWVVFRSGGADIKSGIQATGEKGRPASPGARRGFTSRASLSPSRLAPASSRRHNKGGRCWTAQAREPRGPLGVVVRPPDEILKELDEYYERFKREADGAQKRRALHCIQRALIRSQELGDEKIQLVSQMVELVENRARQVDSHVELLEAQQEAADATGHSKAGQDKSKNEAIAQAEKPNNKRSRRQRNNENRENAANNHDHDDVTSGTPKEKKAKASKKKKRSKAKAEREASPADLPIDPNEPTYCLCNQVSYGEMIGCDNDECPIEWFHFSCVGLSHKPKGKWYCPKCRGESEKTMDKALEKSKRERAYNR
ncbi:inhibitor of growth protein 1 isoform X1 [Bos taurus]|uniref:Inhibitor of growth protein n=1 Tax=Bos taurus TaxID=9913 RepID=A0A3Q1LN25_BOVIN|nr:inhibitor of growth protein 1 isoform X1 [Bos taurus]